MTTTTTALSSPTSTHVSWIRRHHRGLITTLIIALIEVVLFNLGFWMSLTQPPRIAVSPSHITLGQGLTPSALDDILTVTDSGSSYVEIDHVDAAVSTVHLTPTTAEPATTTANSTKSRYDSDAPQYSHWASARIDVMVSGSQKWQRGTPQNYSAGAPASTFLTNTLDPSQKVAKIRVWFLQEEQSSFSYAGLSLNEYQGFSLNPVRIAFMSLIAVFAIGFRPGSRLYKTRLDTTNPRQRALLAVSMIPFVLIFIGVVVAQLGYSPLAEWKEAGDYTYDFDQYDHLATSLLKGLPWLDLPVPDALASATNPYSVQTRASLLAQGTTPIFWDHAFWNGHWYCYFGILPAVVFYVPFKAVTSLWVEGGATLPSPDVVALLLGLFALFATLMVVRFVARHFPATSLGMTILSVIGFLCGANLFFLAFRMNFYAIPMLSSLTLTMMGLWFWFGARRVHDSPALAYARNSRDAGSYRLQPSKKLRTHAWTVADSSEVSTAPGALYANGSMHLSKLRVGAGFLCMAANLGCRPTFILATFLALPIFWCEIRDGLFFSYLNPRIWKSHTVSPLSSLRNDGAALLPAVAICLPVVAYNFWRFGSFLDFGNDYQLTVTDLTTYKEPLNLVAPITYYYLFQPLKFTAEFPLLKLTQTPLSSWQLTEPHAGGFFWLIPFALLGLAVLLMRSIMRRQKTWGLLLSMLALAGFLCVFDAYKAGLSWRYMADFGWLISLPALAAACGFEMWARQHIERGSSSRASLIHLSATRVVVAALVGIGLLLTFMTCFMPGRIDNLMANTSPVFFEVQAWFTNWSMFI